MSDGAVVCSVCGLEPVAVFNVQLPPLSLSAGYAACPYHVDTVIARMQEQLHETLDEHQGVLVDWWSALHPSPEEAP